MVFSAFALSVNAESLGIAVAARVAISAETTANSASDDPVARKRVFLNFFILNTVIISFDLYSSHKFYCGFHTLFYKKANIVPEILIYHRNRYKI